MANIGENMRGTTKEEADIKVKTKSQCASDLEELIRDCITIHPYDKKDIDNLIRKWRWK